MTTVEVYSTTTPNTFNTASYDALIDRVTDVVDGTQEGSTLKGRWDRDCTSLAASLEAPHLVDTTVTIFERSLAATAAFTPETTVLRSWVCGVMGDPLVASRLVELYHQNPGTPLAERILNAAIAKMSRDKGGWDTEEILDTMVAGALPGLLAEAAMPQAPIVREATRQRDTDLIGAAVNLLSYSRSNVDRWSLTKTIMGLWRNNATHAYTDRLMDEALNNEIATRRILELWGLNARELEAAWEVGYGQDVWPDDTPRDDSLTVEEYRHENARRIKELEHEWPGTSRILRQTHKIRNFARNTTQVLLGQRENLRRHYARNVVFACAKRCQNGSDYGKKEARAEIFEKLTKAGVGVHVVEYESLKELEDLLRGWHAARPNEKFDVIVPFGHGDGYSVEVAKSYARKTAGIQYITAADLLKGPTGKLIAQVASPDLVVAMRSCKSALDKVGGLAVSLWRAIGCATVIGSDDETSLNLSIGANNGRVLGVVAIYRKRIRKDDKAWTGKDVDSVVFPAP